MQKSLAVMRETFLLCDEPSTDLCLHNNLYLVFETRAKKITIRSVYCSEIAEKTPEKGGCQGSGSLAFIMKKFFKQETVVCLSFCFVCFYGYSI